MLDTAPLCRFNPQHRTMMSRYLPDKFRLTVPALIVLAHGYQKIIISDSLISLYCEPSTLVNQVHFFLYFVTLDVTTSHETAANHNQWQLKPEHKKLGIKSISNLKYNKINSKRGIRNSHRNSVSSMQEGFIPYYLLFWVLWLSPLHFKGSSTTVPSVLEESLPLLISRRWTWLSQ